MRNGGYKRGNTAIISKDLASIIASAESGYLNLID